MKAIFLILTSFCFSALVHAQKDFHGEIIYKLHASGEAQPDAELKVLFGERKLKLFFKEKEAYDKDAVVVLLDSGATFTLNVADKSFKKKMLAITNPMVPAIKKRISGYATTPFQPEHTGSGGLLSKLTGGADATFYLADSLTYFVPEKYRNNIEFVTIQQGKIVLGAEIQIPNAYSSDEEEDTVSKSSQLITAEAISIRYMTIDESEFIIPADFVDRKNVSGELPTISFQPPLIVDTTTAVMDSAVKVMRTTKKKMPASKGKSKTKATIKPKTAAKKEP
jgi:hypothetical protein